MQRDQSEVAQQVSSLQTEKRVSYGNDALMPSQTYSTTPLDSVPPEQDGPGFVHPESFNQANTENHGKHFTNHASHHANTEEQRAILIRINNRQLHHSQNHSKQ